MLDVSIKRFLNQYPTSVTICTEFFIIIIINGILMLLMMNLVTCMFCVHI